MIYQLQSGTCKGRADKEKVSRKRMCLCNTVLALCDDKNVSSLSVSVPLDKNSLLSFLFLLGSLRPLGFTSSAVKQHFVFVRGFSVLDKRDMCLCLWLSSCSRAGCGGGGVRQR